jgi:hypothetical protein
MFYLVQRMKSKEVADSEKSPSFDQLWKMDYMGSAEFEFGALPKSLKRICRRLDEYHVYTLTEFKRPKTDEAVRVFCLPEQLNEITEGIRALLESEYPKMQMKERAEFYTNFHGTETNYSCVDAWWEIDNDFFFAVGKQHMKNILKALKNTATKHKTDWNL